jgi:thiol-disulfide isomerase/thioredoxin
MLTGFVLTLVVAGAGAVSLPFLFKKTVAHSIENQMKPPLVPLQEKADFAWKIRDEKGVVQDMEQYRGRPLFLVFWDPDCTACLAEMGSLNRLYEKLADTPLAFLAVSFTGGQAFEAARADNSLIFPAFVLEGKRPAVFDSTAMPAAYVVDAAGEVVFKHLGPAKWDDPACVDYMRKIAVPETH